MIRRLKAAWLFARYAPWVDAPDWETKDAHALAAFIHSETGQKFAARLRNSVLAAQANAVERRGDRDFEAGIAVGQRIAANDIEMLANPENFPAQDGGEGHEPATN